MKKIALLLVAAAAFSSCSKKDDPTPVTPPTTTTPTPSPVPGFTIDGIRDVKLEESATSNILSLVVNRINSNQAPVALSVSGLPAGVTAKFDPANGTPSFNTTVTFSYDYTGTGGTYPVKIIGNSDSGKKEYSFNMTVPATPSNGWVIGTSAKTASEFGRDSVFYNPYYGRSLDGSASDGSYIRFILRYDTPFPGKDMTYKLRYSPSQADEMNVFVSTPSATYNSIDADSNTVVLTYRNGKYAVRVNTMLRDTKTGEMKRVVANLSE